MPGVARVATNGRIAPTVGITLEPARQPHQFRDVADHVLVVAERPETLAGHLGAHGLVVAERDVAVLVGAGSRLADVVEQGGEPEPQRRLGLGGDRDRVGQHVLVAVDRVLLEPERGQFGHDLVGQRRVDEAPKPRSGVGHQQHAGQLRAGLDGGFGGGHGLETVALRAPGPAIEFRPSREFGAALLASGLRPCPRGRP